MPTPSPSSGEQAGTAPLCRVSASVVSSARTHGVNVTCQSFYLPLFPVRCLAMSMCQSASSLKACSNVPNRSVFQIAVTAMKDPTLKRTTSSPKWRTARTSAATATSTARPSSVRRPSSNPFCGRLVVCPPSSSLLATASRHKYRYKETKGPCLPPICFLGSLRFFPTAISASTPQFDVNQLERNLASNIVSTHLGEVRSAFGLNFA